MHSSKKLLFEKYLLIAYLLPVVGVLWFITNFNVNVPFLDELSLASFFNKIASGSVTFGDFFAQNNEHRLFFPKIIFIILAFSSGWDISWEMYFSVFLEIVSFCTIYRIASDNLNQDKVLFHLFNIATCILLFSPIQSENWLWGFQLAWFFINTCVTLAIFFLVVPRKLLPLFRISISAILCFIASFSSAHGLFSWIALIPTVASVEGSNKQKKFRVLIWSMLFLLSLFIYQIGYVKPSRHPDILFFLKNPIISVTYLLTLLGNSIGNVIIPTPVVGFIIVSIFVLFNIYYLKNYKSEFAHNTTPWLSLGWFGVLFALLTTLGRSGFGVEQAKSSRYTTMSILLVIALLQILRLLIYYKRNWKMKNVYRFSFCIFFVSCLIGLSNSSDQILQARETWLTRSAGKTCFEIVHFLEQSIHQQRQNCLAFIYPYKDQSEIIKIAEVLQRIGFRNFPTDIPFKTNTITNYGYIDTPSKTDKLLVADKNDKIQFSGWAMLPENQEQPRIVLLSYNNKKSFFGNAVARLDRPDVAKFFNSASYLNSGWSVDISSNSMPIGENVVKAWVYDSRHKQFIKLGGEVKIKIVN